MYAFRRRPVVLKASWPIVVHDAQTPIRYDDAINFFYKFNEKNADYFDFRYMKYWFYNHNELFHARIYL